MGKPLMHTCARCDHEFEVKDSASLNCPLCGTSIFAFAAHNFTDAMLETED